MSENEYGTIAERVVRGITWITEQGEQFGCSLVPVRERAEQEGILYMSSGYGCALALAGNATYFTVQARIAPSLSEAERECLDVNCNDRHDRADDRRVARIDPDRDSFYHWTRWAVEHGFMRTEPTDVQGFSPVRAQWRSGMDEWAALGEEWVRQLTVTSDV